MSRFFEKKKWENYIQYLHAWADDHSTNEYIGQSPACYDEWCDNEWDNYSDRLFDIVTGLEKSKDWKKAWWSNNEKAELTCIYKGMKYCVLLKWDKTWEIWDLDELTGCDEHMLIIDWLLERDEFWLNEKVRELLGL